MTFKIGDRVATFIDDDYNEFIDLLTYIRREREGYVLEVCNGVIKEIMSDSKVVISFDEDVDMGDENWDDNPYKLPIDPSLVALESEVELKTQALEDEFEAVAKQVEEKLMVAVRAIKEARGIADGFDFKLGEFDDQGLVHQMERAGWIGSQC